MLLNIKEDIVKNIYDILKDYGINKTDIILEEPKNNSLGDICLPCFSYAKIMKKSPNQIAELVKSKLDNQFYEKVEVVNGYLNIFLNKKDITKEVLNKIINEKENYGNNTLGNNKTIVIDYSAPNIAKPFSVAHLRSTVIGNALRKILAKLGYKVVGINYIGDWGTQFGKLMYAYKTWGNEEALKENPIDELKRVYIKFHKEAENDDSLNDEGRKWFKKLEEREPEALGLWEYFKETSLKTFSETYKFLGMNEFDLYQGESFFNDKTGKVIAEIEQKKLLKIDEGAGIVDLGDDIAPALIKRNDGASLYITRDLAAAIYRKNEYNFDEALYVVGNEQTLHFIQLKKVLEKMGYEWAENIHHISFGMILQDGKKMSTRHGRTVNLMDVLNEAVSLAEKYIEEKNPNLEDKEKISKMIGIGAVVFDNLKNYRKNDIDFNLKNILKFEGETAPYICYTYARIKSLLKGINIETLDNINIDISEYVWNVILKILNFEEIILLAKQNYDPSVIAKYLIDLAQEFNKLYSQEKIISEDIEQVKVKSLLCECISIILKEGMNLLGINIPNKM